jgi:hypothetical protein
MKTGLNQAGFICVWAAITLLPILVTSCLEIEKYDIEPRVKYKEFRYTDTTLVFTFTDGDGDFGLYAYDTFPPYDKTSIYHKNIYLTFEEKSDTGFRPVAFDDPKLLNARAAADPPKGQNKTMLGTIEYNIHQALNPLGTYPMPDSFRFTFYIYDRSLHQSNVVTTPALGYPK